MVFEWPVEVQSIVFENLLPLVRHVYITVPRAIGLLRLMELTALGCLLVDLIGTEAKSDAPGLDVTSGESGIRIHQ
jgi:hypothetical protein